MSGINAGAYLVQGVQVTVTDDHGPWFGVITGVGLRSPGNITVRCLDDWGNPLRFIGQSVICSYRQLSRSR